MSSPIQPRLPNTALRTRNPIPFARTDVKARATRPATKPGDPAAREPAPARDLLASLGF